MNEVEIFTSFEIFPSLITGGKTRRGERRGLVLR